MNLHRAQHKPDWELLPRESHTFWQRLAAQSRGIVTPGNAASVIGLLLVLLSLLLIGRQLGIALFLMAVGRSFDIVDGWLAHITSTKSPLGELVDAICDKITIFMALVACVTSGLIPYWVILLIALPNVLASCISTFAKILKRPLHTTAFGKVGTFLQWTALIGILLSTVVPVLYPLNYLVLIGGIGSSLIACLEYAHAAMKQGNRRG